MDVVRLHQAGITYAVATLGTATTPEHLQQDLPARPARSCSVSTAIAPAARPPGAPCENALPLARDGRELKFLFLPEGHDPDSLVGRRRRARPSSSGCKLRCRCRNTCSSSCCRRSTSSTSDGRAKLAALARPLFARMPEGVYRELLADRLAAQIRMPAPQVEGAAAWRIRTRRLRSATEPGAGGRSPMRAGRSMTAGRRSWRAGRGNLLRQAITLVLHYPAAARAVRDADALAARGQAGGGGAAGAAVAGRRREQPNTAMLLERWRDRPEYRPPGRAGGAPSRWWPTRRPPPSELQMAVAEAARGASAPAQNGRIAPKSRGDGLELSTKRPELSPLLKVEGAVPAAQPCLARLSVLATEIAANVY